MENVKMRKTSSEQNPGRATAGKSRQLVLKRETVLRVGTGVRAGFTNPASSWVAPTAPVADTLVVPVPAPAAVGG